MTALAGTRTLTRLALRRDRVMLPAWIVLLAGAGLAAASSYSDLYKTAKARHELIAGNADNGVTLALYGRIYGDSVGGITAWRIGGLALALVGLMSILVVIRHTRADEESERAELVGAGAVGRHAPLAAALLAALAGNVALAATVAAGLIGIGLPAGGSVTLAAVMAGAGCTFAAVAAVAAQLSESARTANGIAGGILGAAFLVRAVGDAGPHWLSWLSPLGWLQQVRAFAGDRWWVLALVAALVATLLATAYRLNARRDLGAGLLPPRRGPAVAAPRLRSPLALAWRLQRGALAAWAAGFAIVGAAIGGVADGIGDFVANSPSVKDALTELGGQKGLVDAYIAAVMQIGGLVAAFFAVQVVLRLRAEETGQRAEPLLATAISRTRWALGYVAIALAGTVAVLAALGIAAGVVHGARSGDMAEVPRLLAAALVQLPAAWDGCSPASRWRCSGSRPARPR